MSRETSHQQIHSSTLFFVALVAFLAGVLWESFWSGEVFTKILFVALVSTLLLGIAWSRRMVLVVACIAVPLLIGLWRTHAAIEWADDMKLAGKNFAIEGVINREPIPTKSGWRLFVHIDRCEPGGCEGEKIMLTGEKWTAYDYGDRVSVLCTLDVPENFSDDFDWRRYLNKEGVRYVCDEKPTVVSPDNGNVFYAKIIALRRSLEKNVSAFLVEPYAALGNGLLFGGDGRLSEEMQTMFANTSMTHIVAVSGYNVSILAAFFLALGLSVGLWRQQAFWFALAGVVLFVIIIGFPASAVRAGVMGVIVLVALRTGRKSDATNALFFAGAAMAFVSPLIVRYDVGFQLSFMATLGILLFIPILQEKLPFVSKLGEIGQIFLATLSAQLFTVPIVAINFHQISFISIVVNILVLWIIPFTMISVFAVAILAFVHPFLALPFAFMAHGMLWYEVTIIHFFSTLTWGVGHYENLSWGFAIVWYGILFSGVWWMKRK